MEIELNNIYEPETVELIARSGAELGQTLVEASIYSLIKQKDVWFEFNNKTHKVSYSALRKFILVKS